MWYLYQIVRSRYKNKVYKLYVSYWSRRKCVPIMNNTILKLKKKNLWTIFIFLFSVNDLAYPKGHKYCFNILKHFFEEKFCNSSWQLRRNSLYYYSESQSIFSVWNILNYFLLLMRLTRSNFFQRENLTALHFQLG